MKLNAYVIFDSKAAIYNKPFYFHNDEIAKRAALDLLQDPNTDVSRHPEDFTLCKIGTYEDTTATFELLEIKEITVVFHELKALSTTQEGS